MSTTETTTENTALCAVTTNTGLPEIHDWVDLHTWILLENPKAAKALAACQTQDEINSVVQEAREAVLRRFKDRWTRAARRIQNRGEYQPSCVVTARADTRINPTVMRSYRYITPVQAPSLLTAVMDNCKGHDMAQIRMWAECELKSEDWDAARSLMTEDAHNVGWAIIEGKALVRLGSPLWNLMAHLFPTAIDAAAYGPSILNSPIMPRVDAGVQRVYALFIPLTSDEGEDLGTDGSGWCSFKFSPHPIQVRGIEADSGLFAKGMLFPRYEFQEILDAHRDQFPEDVRDLVEEENCVILDLNQIKGRQNGTAKISRKNDEAWFQVLHLGVINQWAKPSKISMCFEGLQQIKRTARTEEIVDTLVNRAMKKLVKGGAAALLEKAGSDSPRVKLMINWAEKLGINPLSIPGVLNKVRDVLQSQIYTMTQGAGVSGDQLVLRLDSTIPVGSCVAYGYTPGTELAVTRYPMVMAQALKVLTVIPATGHLTTDGATPPLYSLAMNPLDAVDMQGDDDGDIVLCSSDPLVVELFRHRLTNARASIEMPAKAEKFNIPTATKAGLEWIAYDHTGPVGAYTLMQAELLMAATHHDPHKRERAARAAQVMALAIQAAVDASKKTSVLIKYEAFTGLHSVFEKHEDGLYHIREDWMQRDDQGNPVIGFYDLEEISRIHTETIISMGFSWKTDQGQIKALNLIKTWRRRTKRQDPMAWQEPRRFEEDLNSLVLFSYEQTRDCWNEFGYQLRIFEPYAFKPNLITTTMSEADFDAQAKTHGLYEYGREMSKILSALYDSMEVKAKAIQECEGTLDEKLAVASPEFFSACWYWLNTQSEREMMRNPEKSEQLLYILWTVMSCEANPLLTTYGIAKGESKCLADTGTTYEQVIDRIWVEGDLMASASALWSMSAESMRHQRIVAGVHVLDCQHCMKRLEDLLLHKHRGDVNTKLAGAHKSIIRNLNARQSATRHNAEAVPF